MLQRLCYIVYNVYYRIYRIVGRNYMNDLIWCNFTPISDINLVLIVKLVHTHCLQDVLGALSSIWTSIDLVVVVLMIDLDET